MPGRRTCNILEVRRIVSRKAALDWIDDPGGAKRTGRIQKQSSYAEIPAWDPTSMLNAGIDWWDPMPHTNMHEDTLYRAPTDTEMGSRWTDIGKDPRSQSFGPSVGAWSGNAVFCKPGDVLEVIFDKSDATGGVLSGSLMPYVRLGSTRHGTTAEYPNFINRNNQDYNSVGARGGSAFKYKNVSRIWFVVPHGATTGHLTIMARKATLAYTGELYVTANSALRENLTHPIQVSPDAVPIFVGPNTSGKVCIDGFQIGKTNVDRDAANSCQNLEEYTMPWGAFTNNGSTSTIGTSPLPSHPMGGGYGASSSSSYTMGGSYWPVGFSAQQVHHITNYAKEMSFKIGIGAGTNSLAKMAMAQMMTFMSAALVLSPLAGGIGAGAMMGGALASAYLAGIAMGQSSGGGTSVIKMHRRRPPWHASEKEKADVTVARDQSANVQFLKLFRHEGELGGGVGSGMYAKSGTLSSFIMMDFSRMRYVPANQLHESVASDGIGFNHANNAVGQPKSAATRSLDCHGAIPTINVGYDSLTPWVVNAWAGISDSGEPGGASWYFDCGKGPGNTIPYSSTLGGTGFLTLFGGNAFRRTKRWGLKTHDLAGGSGGFATGENGTNYGRKVDGQEHGPGKEDVIAHLGITSQPDFVFCGGRHHTQGGCRDEMGDLFSDGWDLDCPNGGLLGGGDFSTDVRRTGQRFFTLPSNVPVNGAPLGNVRQNAGNIAGTARQHPFSNLAGFKIPTSYPNTPAGVPGDMRGNSIIPIVSAAEGPKSGHQPGSNSICGWNKGHGCFYDERLPMGHPDYKKCEPDGGRNKEWLYPHDPANINGSSGNPNNTTQGGTRRRFFGAMTPGFSPPPFRNITQRFATVPTMWGTQRHVPFAPDHLNIQFFDATRSEGLGNAGGLYFPYFYATAIGRKDVLNSRVYTEDFKYTGRGATDWGRDARYCLSNKSALGWGGWYFGEKAEPHFWLEGRKGNVSLGDIEGSKGTLVAKVNPYEAAKKDRSRSGDLSFYKTQDLQRHHDGVSGVCDSTDDGESKNVAGHHYGGWPLNILTASGPYHRQAGSACQTDWETPSRAKVWYKIAKTRHNGKDLPLIPAPVRKDPHGFWASAADLFQGFGADEVMERLQRMAMEDLATFGWQTSLCSAQVAGAFGGSSGAGDPACEACHRASWKSNAKPNAGKKLWDEVKKEWTQEGDDALLSGCLEELPAGQTGGSSMNGKQYVWASSDCCEDAMCDYGQVGGSIRWDPTMDENCPPEWGYCLKAIIRTYVKPPSLTENMAGLPPASQSDWLLSSDPQGSQAYASGSFDIPPALINQKRWGIEDAMNYSIGTGVRGVGADPAVFNRLISALGGGAVGGGGPIFGGVGGKGYLTIAEFNALTDTAGDAMEDYPCCLDLRTTPGVVTQPRSTSAMVWGNGHASVYGWTQLKSSGKCRTIEEDWFGHGWEMWDSGVIPTYQLNDVNWIDIYMGNANKFNKLRSNGQFLLTEKVDNAVVLGAADNPQSPVRLEGASPHYEFRPGEWVVIKMFPNTPSTGTPTRAPVLRRFHDVDLLQGSDSQGAHINMVSTAASGLKEECPEKAQADPGGTQTGTPGGGGSQDPPIKPQVPGDLSPQGKCPNPSVDDHWPWAAYICGEPGYREVKGTGPMANWWERELTRNCQNCEVHPVMQNAPAATCPDIGPPPGAPGGGTRNYDGGVDPIQVGTLNLGAGNMYKNQRLKLVGDNLGKNTSGEWTPVMGGQRIGWLYRWKAITHNAPNNIYQNTSNTTEGYNVPMGPLKTHPWAGKQMGSGLGAYSRGPATIIMLEKDPKYAYPPSSMPGNAGFAGAQIHNVEYLGYPPVRAAPSESLLFNMNQLCIHIGQNMTSISHLPGGHKPNGTLVDAARQHQTMFSLSLGLPISPLGLIRQIVRGDSSSFYKGLTYDSKEVKSKLAGTSGEALQPTLFDDMLFAKNHLDRPIVTLGKNGLPCEASYQSAGSAPMDNMSVLWVQLPQGHSQRKPKDSSGLGVASKLYSSQLWINGERRAPSASLTNSFHYHEPIMVPINIYNKDKVPSENHRSIMDTFGPPKIREFECPSPESAVECNECDNWQNERRIQASDTQVERDRRAANLPPTTNCVAVDGQFPPDNCPPDCHRDCYYFSKADCEWDRDCGGASEYDFGSSQTITVDAIGAAPIMETRLSPPALLASAYQWQWSNNAGGPWTNVAGDQGTEINVTMSSIPRGCGSARVNPPKRFWRVIVRNEHGTVISQVCDILDGGNYALSGPTGECKKCYDCPPTASVGAVQNDGSYDFPGIISAVTGKPLKMSASAAAAYRSQGIITGGSWTSNDDCAAFFKSQPTEFDTGCNQGDSFNSIV